MQVLRAADHKVMPWKNGAGSTTEIAIFPEGAGLEAFGWRLSMAGVTADGPFSAFAGIERTLAVLEGEGIALDIEGRGTLTVTRDGKPASFPGDAPTAGRLLGGPILDLNVMSRRGRFGHRLTRYVVDGMAAPEATGDTNLLLARADGLSVADTRLGRNDTLRIEGPARLDIAGKGEVFLVELWAEG
jgi:environmental stress-induced protein Ves